MKNPYWLVVWNVYPQRHDPHAYIGPFPDVNSARLAGEAIDLIDNQVTWSVCHEEDK